MTFSFHLRWINFYSGCNIYRETLLGQLRVFIKQIKDDFLQKTSHGDKLPQGKNVPETVNNIVWARQLEAKVCSYLSNDI